MKRQVPFQGLELPAVDEADEVVRRDRFTNLGGRLSIFGWSLFLGRRITNSGKCLMDFGDDAADVVDLDRVVIELCRRDFCGQRHQVSL